MRCIGWIHAAVLIAAMLAADPSAAATVTGRVLGPSGAPVAEAAVVAFNVGSNTRSSVGEGSTGPDGRYRLEVPEGMVEIKAQAPGLFTPRAAVVDAREGTAATADVRLGVARVITGRVLDSAGAPIKVPTSWIDSKPVIFEGPSVSVEDCETECDAEGNFRLDCVAPGSTVRVTTFAMGFTSKTEIVPPDRSTLSIVLEKARCLTLLILGSDRKPLAGKSADISWQLSGKEGGFGGIRTRLDGRGGVQMCAGVGSYDVAVAVEGWAAKVLRGFEVPVSSGARDVVVQLDPGDDLAGTVKDKQGRSIRGATVSLWVDAGMPRSASVDRSSTAITDQEGRFHIAGVGTGDAEVRVEADGYSAERRHLGRQRGAAMDFMLATSAIVRGRVVDREGRPIAGALVVISEHRVDEPVGFEPQALSGHDGAFLVAGVDRGVQHARAMTADGRKSRDVELVVGDRDPAPLNLTIGGARLEGRIAGLSRDDLARLQVKASYLNESDVLTPAVDPDGRLVLQDLLPGALVIEARVGERAARELVHVKDGADVLQVELELSSTCTLRGRVLRGGTPAPDLDIWIVPLSVPSGFDARSGADGTFVVEGLPCGEASLNVTLGHRWIGHSGRQLSYSQEVNVTGAETPITISVPNGVLRGRVLSVDGSAIAGADIDVTLMLEGRGLLSLSATSDATGAFTVADAADGPCNVSLTAPGHTTVARSLECRSSKELLLQVEPEGAVTVSVVRRETGAPCDDADFQLAGGYTQISTVRDGDHFRLSGIGPTPVDLLVTANGAAPVLLPKVRAPADLRVEVSSGGMLEVRHQGTVTIQVLGPSGVPEYFTMGMMLTNLAESGDSPVSLSVRSGVLTLRAKGADGVTTEKPVSIVDGQTTVVELP